MHIRHLLPGLLLAALLVGGCVNPFDSSAPSVAVVDSARIFKESEPGKAGIKHLETLHESMQAQLIALQEALMETPNDVALQQKLQEKYLVYQQRISVEQQQVINILNDAIQQALDACRVQQNLAVIVGTDVVLSHGPAADITDAVIREVNKTAVAFTPLEPEVETVTSDDEDEDEDTDSQTPAQDATQTAPEQPAAQ